MKNLKETFTYGMNRLTGVTLKRPSGQDLVCSVTYDALGRMTSRQAVTAENGVPQVTSVFSDAVYNTTAKPHAMDTATTAAGLFPLDTQSITYTGFDKVGKVKQGADSVCYTYGYDRQRILMEEHVCGLTRTKQYWGACEYVTESDGSNTSSLWRTFVAGPYGVFAVVESHNGIDETHYVLKDNLGSWTTITDGNGTVEQRLSYDAWGNLRDPNTWANYTVGDSFAKPMFDRDYTGHEHLTDFGLINMNGRVYDPVMSSFLSADRFVQNPMTAMGFNRYSYCMNNPLRFIDPTGWLPGDGGSGGSLPYVIIGGQANYILPEITITPDDNPSLSNPHEKPNYPTHYYGSSPTDLPAWGDPSNGPSIGWSNGTGCGGGSGTHGGKTMQYRVNEIGTLPLDVNHSLGYHATQVANYKMLYNVTVYHFTNLNVKSEELIGVSVSGLSFNTLVNGDVQASAKATLYVDNVQIDSQPFVIDPQIAVLNPINTTYIGCASFVCPASELVVLQINGGWSVNLGTGWMVPTKTIFGPTINANKTIYINP